MTDLAKLKELLHNSTPRPWKWHRIRRSFFVLFGGIENPDFDSIDAYGILDDGSAGGEYCPIIKPTDPNAQLIVEAINSLPELIERLERYEKELKWYADDDNYEKFNDTYVITGKSTLEYETTWVHEDRGSRARQALADVEEGL